MKKTDINVIIQTFFRYRAKIVMVNSIGHEKPFSDIVLGPENESAAEIRVIGKPCWWLISAHLILSRSTKARGSLIPPEEQR